MLTFDTYFYHLPSSLTCTVNSTSNNCVIQDATTVFIPLNAPLTSNLLHVQVRGAVNYIRPAGWSIRSVRSTASGGYSDVDVYSTATPGVGAMAANAISSRVLFPNNYAQTGAVSVKIAIDSAFANAPLNALRLNASIPEGNCQLLQQSFSSELTLTCSFPVQTTAQVKVVLYHPLCPTVTLAAVSTSLPIMAAPTSNCGNQMCDSCSSLNGQ